MAKMEDYPITIKDAARRLGATCNATRRFVAAGKLKAERFGPLRELRFRDEDLDDFMAKVDPARLHRQIIQKIKDTEPHYQGLMMLPGK